MLFGTLEVIDTIDTLLECLYAGSYGQGMTGARIEYTRYCDKPHEAILEIGTDDGKGHSNAFRSHRIPVALNIFGQAKQERLIEGVKKPGYVSDSEFVLSHAGRLQYLRRLEQEREKVRQKLEACTIPELLDGLLGTRVEQGLGPHEYALEIVRRLMLNPSVTRAEAHATIDDLAYLNRQEGREKDVANLRRNLEQWLEQIAEFSEESPPT